MVDPEVPEVREVDSVNSLDGDDQVPTDHQGLKDREECVQCPSRWLDTSYV